MQKETNLKEDRKRINLIWKVQPVIQKFDFIVMLVCLIAVEPHCSTCWFHEIIINVVVLYFSEYSLEGSFDPWHDYFLTLTLVK